MGPTKAEQIRQFADSIGATADDLYEAYESHLSEKEKATLRNLFDNVTLSDYEPD